MCLRRFRWTSAFRHLLRSEADAISVFSSLDGGVDRDGAFVDVAIDVIGNTGVRLVVNGQYGEGEALLDPTECRLTSSLLLKAATDLERRRGKA